MAETHKLKDASIIELSSLVEQPGQLKSLQLLMQDIDKHYVHVDSLLVLIDAEQLNEAEAYAVNNLAPFYRRQQTHLINLSDEITASSRKYTAEFIPAVSNIVDGYAILLFLAAICTVWAGYTLGKAFKQLQRENNTLNAEIKDRKELQQALVESQEQYKQLFNSNPIPMWVYDQHTLRFLEVNEAAIKEYGYSREEFMQMTLRDIRPAEDLAKFDERMQSINKASNAASKRFFHQRKDGRKFKVELGSHALTVEAAIFPRLVVAVNVQEREEAMQQLKKSEKQLREISSSLPGAVFQYQMDHNYSFSFPFISDGVLPLCGVTPEEVYKNPVVLYHNLHPDDLIAVQESTLASYNKLTPWEAEFRVWQPEENKYKWVRGHSHPSSKGNGTVIWNGTFINISSLKETQEELESSKAHLRALLDSSPQAIYLLDEHRKIVAFNKVAECEVLTYSLTSLDKGLDILDLIDPIHREQFLDNHAKAMQGHSIQYEHGTGGLWHEVTFKPVYDAAGQIINITLSVHNKTEQKKAIENIKKNEAQLSKAQRIAKLGSWEYDLKKELLTMSRTLYDIFTIPYSDQVPSLLSLSTRFHPDDREDALKLIDRAIHAKEDLMYEHRIITKDGSIKYLSHITETVRDEDGNAIIIAGTAQDITDRKLTEQEVIEAKNLLQSTIENIPELIFSADTNLAITYISPQCHDITGYPEENFLGNKEAWIKMIHNEDQHTLLTEVLPKVLEGTQQQFELRIVNRNEQIKWVIFRLSPKKDEKGNVIRIDGAASDVSNYKETEAKRLKLTEQLLKQNQSLQQFAYIVSHNLRAPVANLLGWSPSMTARTPWRLKTNK
ncbi:hypothetical protein GCM10028895_01310 [Pontibacter rugosus]